MHKSIETIATLFRRHGDKHLGERCTQYQHAAQCAALAEWEGCSHSMICAAFLHDIGHLYAVDRELTDTNELGHSDHARIGAALLRELGFPQSLTAPIALHVAAKRFLAAADSCYREQLSAASSNTLQSQGAAMNWDEQQQFLKQPYAQQALCLRRWDDTGKAGHLAPAEESHWLAVCNTVLMRSAMFSPPNTMEN